MIVWKYILKRIEILSEYDFRDSENAINFEVTENYDNLENYLKEKHNISSRLIKRVVRERMLFLNEEKVRRYVPIKKGDKITLLMTDEETETLPDSDIELNIIYEDDDLLAINKEPDTVVHTTRRHPLGTVANGVADYFIKNGIKKTERFINRLDKNTSGVLLVGKNAFSHQQVSDQFKNDEVIKYYLAIVDGIVEKDCGTIDLPIEREEEESVKRIVRADGKRAVTHYEVVKRYKNASLLKVRLETGRTHQIRVHLEYVGHPIIGDSLYFKESELIDRQALHSYSLEITQPRSRKKLLLTAELPEDMKRLIKLVK